MTIIEKPETAVRAHPLEMLTPEEITKARQILVRKGFVNEHTRFAYLGLEEPEKAELYGDADHLCREVRVMLLQLDTGVATDLKLCLDAGYISWQKDVDPLTEGQVPVLVEEFDSIEEILALDDGWAAALARRGMAVTDVRVAPLSAGVFDYPGEEGKRLLRGLAFRKDHDDDHAWAHPVDHLVAFVDVGARKVDRIIDGDLIDVPETSGNYHDDTFVKDVRTDLKPIEITQPEGPSFSMEGNLLSWANWKMRVGFDAREGLTLHQITFNDHGEERPIIHRASIAEMVVPYGDPSPYRSWQNYFDTGEYLIGRCANSLELGCDCLGDITYVSPVIADDFGQPRRIHNGICIHEEDAGVLYKHNDDWAGVSEVRRNRKLVVSFFTTVGNYDYGFYWYFFLDGTIEFEAKATGFVFASAYEGEGYEYASEVAPGLGAPYHQHIFSARLDMMVDGFENSVKELNGVRVPMGPGNEHGNAFTVQDTVFSTEQEAIRVGDGSVGRSWRVINPNKKNHLGQPVGYQLYPEALPVLLADDSSSIAKRAAFAAKHLWVTPYRDDERYPCGDYVNRSIGAPGLPEWTSQDRSIENQDIVLWHSFGLTHFPRTEDWPIMPVDTTGFVMKPHGFFDRNPAMDVPANTSKHCQSRTLGPGQDNNCH